MTTAARMAARLDLDSSNYNRGLDQAEARAKTFQSKMKTIGSALMGIGTSMSMFVTAPIVAGFGFAVDASSDLNESMNKAQVVFGDHASEIEVWSASAATALGMTQQVAVEAAGTYGNLFTALGLGKGTAADMSMSLVQLASDLASFNNANPEDVLHALRSGMSGEVEPLKKFGVAMTEATLAEEMMRLGLKGSFKDLTEAQKLQVRYSLIMKQTTTAQGDFARTADGMANSTRTMKAQLGDAAAKLGVQLLPFALKAVQVISQLTTAFTNLSPGMQQAILIILAIVAVIGPLLLIVGSVITAIGAIIPVITAVGGAIGAVSIGTLLPLILIIGAIVGAIALLYIAWTQNWGGIQEKLAAVWAFLQPIFAAIGQVIGIVITAYINQLIQNWNTLMAILQVVWAWVQANIIPLFQAVGNVLSAIAGVAVKALAGLWQNVLLPALINVYTQIYTQLQPVFEALSAFWEETLGPAVKWLSDTLLVGLLTAFADITSQIKTVTDWLNKLATSITSLELPSWLTPGSPTPFEMGLRGISSAMSDLVSSELPGFEAGLQLSLDPASRTGGSTVTQTNYYGAYYGGGPNQSSSRPLDNLRRPM